MIPMGMEFAIPVSRPLGVVDAGLALVHMTGLNASLVMGVRFTIGIQIMETGRNRESAASSCD